MTSRCLLHRRHEASEARKSVARGCATVSLKRLIYILRSVLSVPFSVKLPDPMPTFQRVIWCFQPEVRISLGPPFPCAHGRKPSARARHWPRHPVGLANPDRFEWARARSATRYHEPGLRLSDQGVTLFCSGRHKIAVARPARFPGPPSGVRYSGLRQERLCNHAHPSPCHRSRDGR